MYRGEIWWANLLMPMGSEPGYRRPILIVQDNTFNQSRINTIIAVVITSNTELAKSPGNVLLPIGTSGLSKVSVVNVSQIITIDKNILTERIGRLSENYQEEVDEGLRIILYL